VLASLANALEVRFNLALELQSIATRASREGVLDDIAPQLELNIVSPAFKKVPMDTSSSSCVHHLNGSDSPSAVDTHCKLS
jgi:hypothetical protein